MVWAMKKQPRIVIVGAGPCGLGAGWRLQELGYDNFVLYEKEKTPGGLASSYIDDKGFTWDVGGHVIHSHYPYFDTMFETVMKGEYFTHKRESWIWMLDRFIPYPFQNNIHRLPKAVLKECLEGLKNRKADKKTNTNIQSFADWIIASFGKGIAKHFLFPYNKKIWAYPLEKMSWTWVSDRVANVDVKRIERNISKNTDDINWGPNAVFHYPKKGGTGDIWSRVASHLRRKIVYKKQITNIDSDQKILTFSDGTTDTYDVLLTSMPLDVLTTIISDREFPKSSLKYSRVSVVGLGVVGDVPDLLKNKCWIYFPEDNTPFFRATVLSNYSKYNAPPGTWSLMTETSSFSDKPVSKDIIKDVIQGAMNTKLIRQNAEIKSTWVFQTDHGYPTPTLDRDRYLDTVLPMLEALGIFSRGRFGMWKYEISNQDHTFMQGVEWANYMLLNQKEEIVYPLDRSE